MDLLPVLVQDVRHATRYLARRRGSSISIVVVIGLAIAVNTTVFSAISAVLLRPSPYPEPDHLVRLWFGDQEGYAGRALPEDIADWSDGSDAFEDVAVYRPGIRTLSTDTERGRGIVIAEVSTSMFDVLLTYPTRGRGFLPEDEAEQNGPVAILREDIWNEAPTSAPDRGRYLMLDGVRHRVIGTMPASFDFPDRQTVAWVPLVPRREPPHPPGVARVSVHTVYAVARLKSGVSLAHVRAEALGLFRDRERQSRPHVAVMREIDDRSIRRAIIILQFAVALVLLTACANVAHLMLVRALERRPEFAVRTALGASRSRLMTQWGIEGGLLAGAGGTLGLCLAAWGIAWLNAVAPPDLLRGEAVKLDASVLVFGVVATMATAVLMVMAPGLQTLRLKPEHLDRYRKSAGTGSPVRVRGRRLLIAAQFAVALALLATTVVLVKSFLNLVAVDSGFDPAGVATARLRLPTAEYADVDTRTRLLADLIHAAGDDARLQGIALADYFPFDEQHTIDFSIPGTGRLTGRRQAVSEGYFRTLGIPIIRGRDFSETDTIGAPGVVVVSRAFAAKYLDDSDPLTRSIVRSGRTWNVIGVAEDVRGGGLTAPPWPVVYFSFRQLGYEHLADVTALRRVILFARADRGSLERLRDLEGRLQAAEPVLTLDDLAPLEDRLNRPIAAPRFYATMMVGFSTITLLLAVVGVSGLVGYAVARQVPEIALRLALGASRRDVCFEVGRLVLLPMTLGITAGVVLSLWLSWGFRGLLFDVVPFEPVPIAVSVLILLVCAMAACAQPARRAMSIDPASVLRDS